MFYNQTQLDFDYFINLSGQCYPLRSISTIKKTFNGKKTAFIEVLPLPYAHQGRMAGLDRYVYSYYKHPIIRFRNHLVDYISEKKFHENRSWLKLPKLQTKMPYHLKLYGGSAYFCLTKKQVECILNIIETKPKIISFFRRSFAPDEAFFQTILANSEYKSDLENNNLRFIDWSRPGEFKDSPALLTMDDADNLFASEALFARKFDCLHDSEILDLIDKFREQ